MKHRGLLRIAVAAGTVMLAPMVAAMPVAAAPAEEKLAPGYAELQSTAPIAASGFATKSCAGVPGGAKAATDGWVFDQPAGAKSPTYQFVFVDRAADLVFLEINKAGVQALDVPQSVIDAILEEADREDSAADVAKAAEKAQDATSETAEKPSAASGDAGKSDAGKNDAAGSDAKRAEGKADSEELDFPRIAAPAGVAGQLTPEGAWLQTPAGWFLGDGLLRHGITAGTADTFSLLRVCLPAGAPAVPAKPTLPVTGANVALVAGGGTVLVAVGIALFLVRRRREAVTFVA